VLANDELKEAIDTLVAWKTSAQETDTLNRIPVVDTFVEDSLASQADWKPSTSPSPTFVKATLDQEFRDQLKQNKEAKVLSSLDFSLSRVREPDFLLFEAISGSHAYGTQTPDSDLDLKGVFVAPDSFHAGMEEIDQVADQKNDEVYYELSRFFQLLSKNNPTALELLCTPHDCIRTKHPAFDLIDPQIFISKLCQKSFSGYASMQIKKARGLNKKIMNPQPEQRKHLRDFCFVLEGQGSRPLAEWFARENISAENCGLVSVNHAPNTYALFHSHEIDYRGLFSPKDDAALICSSVPHEAKPIAWLNCNLDAFKAHCREHREYWQWVENRNENRYATNQAHGRDYDSKNMMHTLRLLDTAYEIATEGLIKVRRPNAESLLKIRNGELSYEEIMDLTETKLSEIEEAYQNSSLPDEPDHTMIQDLPKLNQLITMLNHEQLHALDFLRSRTWRRLTWPSEKKHIEQLCESLKNGSPELVIPSLAPTFINLPSKYHSILKPLVRSLIDHIPTEKWSFVDQEMRSEFHVIQYQLNSHHRKEVSFKLEDPLEALIALTHPNGFVRQQALEKIKEPVDASTISLLILRCNDWVHQVQEIARSKLFQLQPTTLQKQTGEILTALTLTQRSSRHQDNAIERYLDSSVLSSSEGLNSVLSILTTSKNIAKRKAASRFLIRHQGRLSTSAIDRFLTHGLPNELSLLLLSTHKFSKEQQQLILKRVKNSKLAILRRSRLRLIGELDHEAAQNDFIEALHDVSKSVRSIARFHLSNWTIEQFTQHYLNLLSHSQSSREFRGSLFGLSELRPREAHAISMQMLSTTLSNSRAKTCLECLDLNSSELNEEQILIWLSSPVPAITRACYRSLISFKKHLPAKSLYKIATNPALPSFTRNSSIHLLQGGPKWERLPWLFKLAVSDETELRTQGLVSLNLWLRSFQRSFTYPTPTENKLIQNHFETSKALLEPTLRLQFENLFKSALS